MPLGDAPDGALADIKIAASGKQLWRILNAATDAFLDLALVDANGQALPFEVVARDGSPLTDDAGAVLPPAETRESQLVPPSGRLEILVDAPPAGTRRISSHTQWIRAARGIGCLSGAWRSSRPHRRLLHPYRRCPRCRPTS